MWSKGAVVVVTRGDEAMSQAIKNGIGAETKIPENYETVERDYNVMKVGRESEIREKIRKARNAYGRRPPKIIRILQKPITCLEVIYAMVACCLECISKGFGG